MAPLPLPLPLLLAALPLLGPGADDPPSLQRYLEAVRARRAAQLEGLAEEVGRLLGELEALPPRAGGRDVERRQRALVALGPEIAPLLVPALEPQAPPSNGGGAEAGGDGSTGGGDRRPGASHRPAVAAAVLRELASPAVTDALLELARTGSVEARLRALSVLETSPEPARVAPAVREVYRSGTGEVRQGALLCLARLGGPQAQAILGEALSDDDPGVVDVALTALADEPAAAGQVLVLVRGPQGARHLPALAEFYTTQRTLLDQREHQEALAALAVRSDAPREHVVALLDRLSELGVELERGARKTLEPLGEHSQDSLREAALALLARSGDRGARRDLLAPYDDAVDRQPAYDAVYTSRGDVLFRIGDWSLAVRDYKQAIKLLNARSRTSRAAEPFLGLARCYARMERFKDAADWLDKAPVSLTTLHELADEPAFGAMLDTKYRRAFHLPEDDE